MLFYTDVAVHARVTKPDPRANAEFTKKLNEAMSVATTYFDGAEHFLMAQRGLERADAVLTYDGAVARRRGALQVNRRGARREQRLVPPCITPARKLFPSSAANRFRRRADGAQSFLSGYEHGKCA